MFLLAGTERLNLPRFFGKESFFEVYSLRFNDPKQKVAVWYRQSILLRRKKPAEAGLSIVLYDLEDPERNRICHQTRPLQEARIEDDIFYFSVAGGEFYQKGCHGQLTYEDEPIRWQFEWLPAERSFRHYPLRIFYRPLWPFAKIASPNPDVRLTGDLEWGARRLHFEKVPACQTHIWGRHSAESWTWAQVNQFEDNEDIVFEAVSGRVYLQGRLLPPITMLRIVLHGREYKLNRPWHWQGNISLPHVDRWHFEATSRGMRFIGDVFVDRKELTGFVYEDPDGSQRYIYRTESATLRLQIFRRDKKEWILERTYQSLPAMAYEFAQKEPVADVPLVS